MSEVEKLRSRLPESARDIKLNLQSVFQNSALTPAELWGTAIASAIASRNRELSAAVIADARAALAGAQTDPAGADSVDAVIEDAKAAAALMAMNNVYYRFRHVVGKESYSSMPARLRMNWIARPRGPKIDFELFCLAVSTINNCEVCVRTHENAVIAGGLTEAHVHDAVRVAATLQAAAISLEIPEATSSELPQSVSA